MPKNSYKIPSSLNRSFLDHEVALSGGGFQAKPLPMKVLLFWSGSILTLFWVASSTFVAQAAWWLIALVVIWWLITTAFLGQYSKTKEMKFASVPALLAYVPAAARRVLTRTSTNPSSFYSVVGIDNISATGLIKYSDGTLGQGYLVVGSASILLFEEDRKAILNRVDSFWRKVDTSCEYTFVTTKEPQRVYHQIANLERRNLALEVRDPELKELMDEQYDILNDYVGKQFASIHQYLLLKGDNLESLRRAHSVLQAEVENSSLMIKGCTMLNGDEVTDMLTVLYKGKSS
ncbi:hypothetical protein [Arthrobacter sp. ES1]|uniref:hypothetical protein n=1 Tax=Arthrobacter sp. ES1 TaxID=1897056 RepID=UPI001CFF749D|nr:hypothetical protein [Arthrobacter sp. ES1]MCB5280362.1 hypothetical protein [Arthrobacter sp. ES1]